jgi:radical SAM superfamily enzyme YgiQ (UPF0313 family)
MGTKKTAREAGAAANKKARLCMARARPDGVLLVNYAGYLLTANTFIPDNGLATLAGVLREHDIESQILDFQNPRHIGGIVDGVDRGCSARVLACLKSGEDLSADLFEEYRRQRDAAQQLFEMEQTDLLLERVGRGDVGLVGFKLWGGTGFSGALAMAQAIKRHFPDVRVAAGGPAVRYAGEVLFERTEALDALVYGDGEQAVLRLARGDLDDIPGTIRLVEGRAVTTSPIFDSNLNDIPRPLYDAAVYPNIGDFFNIRVIDDSRGCFNRCSFCSHPFISGHTRRKDAKLIVDEIEHSYRKEGVTYFRLSGSNPPYKLLVSIAEEILSRKLPVFYSAYASMNNLKAQHLPLLAASGLRGLLFGLETGDPEFLLRVHGKKNGSNDEIVQTLETAMRENVFVAVTLIVPSPFETDATKQATKELVRRVFGRYQHGSVVVLPALLSPGSAWWKRMQDYGFGLLPGFDSNRLILSMLDWDPFFMLPRNLASQLGYALNGKTSSELFTECQSFIEELKSIGIPDNVDDAAYMISAMGDMSVQELKLAMISQLVSGNAESLGEIVARVNGAAAAKCAHASRLLSAAG